MKHILKWLKSKFYGHSAINDADEIEMPSDATASDRPDRVRKEAQEVLMPDIYGDGHDATEPDLHILDKSSPDVSKSTGFNPYDTVVLHEKPGSKKP